MKTFFKVFTVLEYLFLVFALPAAVMMSAVEARYTAEHGFWFFFILLFIDTALLIMKEKFGAIKARDIEFFNKALHWYKAYAIVMVVQFLFGIFQKVGIDILALYSLTLLLFTIRYSICNRSLKNYKGVVQ